MILFESFIVGLIVSIIGSVIYYLNVKKKNLTVVISFFITGFCIHLLLEFSGFNKLYCDKKCMKTLEILNK